MRRGYKAEIEALDMDDLHLIKNWTDATMKVRRDENKIALWVVSDDMINYGAFRIDQHGKAVDIACAVLQNKAKHLTNSNLEIKVYQHNFRESEVQDMLDLWEG